jgi:tRNA-specific 2-thiouridylase
VVVGTLDDLHRAAVRIAELNWLADAPAPGEALRVQIRHRARAVDARVAARADGEIVLEFAQPQRAVTPGQSAVMFRDDVVLGGGRIAA